MLVNAIICPFRSPKSAAAYRKVWAERGSPLLFHTLNLADRVCAKLGPSVHVEAAMRYGRPDIAAAVQRCRAAGDGPVVVFPLFPQYASSSTGSALEEVFRAATSHVVVPPLRVVPPFYDAPEFVDAVVAVARDPLADFDADRVLLSFHGLPERQVKACDPTGGRCLRRDDCCDAMVAANRWCYRAQCYATARAVARGLELHDDTWEVAFQSRLGRTPWIRPFTDVRVREMAQSGVRRLAVLVPSFVADCLETLEEIALRARDDFRAAGGEELAQIPCVNATDLWVDGVVKLALGVLGDVGGGGSRVLR
jgi:ferrochelatase